MTDQTVDSPSRRFRPYPEYRDSGVEWLGGIPAHWEPARLWRLCSATSGATPAKENPAYWNGEIPWVSPKDMKRRVISTSEDLITQQALAETGIKRIAPRVVLVVVRGMILAHSFPVAVTAAPVTINQDMKALKLIDGVDASYFAWALDGLARGIIATVVEEAAHGTRVIRMDQWRSLVVPLPPYPEQEAIAAFLDRETAKIDALVARKQRLIELLQEKRTALITRAVTRGLDPNVPLKASGVEWLGEIPAHWEVKKFKRLCLVRRGASPRPIDDPIYFDDDGEYAWVRIADVTASERYLERTTQKLSGLGRSKSVALEPGELFLSIAATVGKPIVTRIKCCIHDGFVYFVDLLENKEYMYYLFSCGEAYKGLGKLGTQLNLNTDTIGDIYVPVPRLEEQEAIVRFLDRGTATIDELIARICHAIDLLTEFRMAVISAAVTGKIDVREAAPR